MEFEQVQVLSELSNLMKSINFSGKKWYSFSWGSQCAF